MIRTALVAVCLFFTAGFASQGAASGQAKAPDADTTKIRVRVSTAAPQTRVPTGDEVLRQRLLAAISDALKGKKDLVLVAAGAPADVTVDVLSPVSLFVPGAAAQFDDKAVPVDVRAAGQTTRIVKSGHDRTHSAAEVAKEIDRWIQANRSKVIAARPPAK
jgi:hypothetical protein